MLLYYYCHQYLQSLLNWNSASTMLHCGICDKPNELLISKTLEYDKC